MDKKYKNLKILNSMNLSPAIKKKLKREAKRWRDFIKDDMSSIEDEMRGDLGAVIDNCGHRGEMLFIEFFFGIKPSKEARKNE
jgi:hypothetical protein